MSGERDKWLCWLDMQRTGSPGDGHLLGFGLPGGTGHSPASSAFAPVPTISLWRQQLAQSFASLLLGLRLEERKWLGVKETQDSALW